MKCRFVKFRRNYLRACLRGYRKAKKLGKLNDLRLLKNDAVNIKLPTLNKHNAYYISEFEPYDTEVVVKQYVLQHYMGQKFVRSIFLSFGRNVPAVVALPSSWRKFLQINGIDLSERKSRIAWSFEVILHLLHGYYVFGNLVLHNLINKAPIAKDDESYAYFYGLSNNNLPSGLRDSFDIINWYSRINCRDKSIANFRHSVANSANKVIGNISIEFEPPPYCKIKSLRKKISFITWGSRLAFIALKDVFVGKWWHALMFREIVKAKAVQLADYENLASEYLFYHSSSVYRPLWTYVPEAKGSDVICYFYSSFDQPQPRKGSASQKYEWSPSTWPKILVWDTYQKELLARDMPSNTNLTVCSPTYFSDISSEIPNSSRPVIAVFNIDPHRASSHFGVSTLADYYDECPTAQRLFLVDIAEVSRKLGVRIFIKLKRDIGNRLPKSYSSCISKVAQLDNVTIIPSDVSAYRLVKHCDAELSAPFTSPTVFGKYLNRPAAYYDACNWIITNDPASRGLPILQGREQLEKWILEIFDQIVDEGSAK